MLGDMVISAYTNFHSTIGDAVSNAIVAGGGSSSTGGDKSWSIEQLLKNATKKAQSWGYLAIAVVGMVGLVFGIIKLVSNFMSKQGPTTPWITVAALIVIGGLVTFWGSSNLLSTIGQGASDSTKNLGESDGGSNYDKTNWQDNN